MKSNPFWLDILQIQKRIIETKKNITPKKS